MWEVKVAERGAPVGRRAWIWSGGGWGAKGGRGGWFDPLVEFSHFQLTGRLAAVGLLNVSDAYLH